jgi:hypothetical protein
MYYDILVPMSSLSAPSVLSFTIRDFASLLSKLSFVQVQMVFS